MTPHYITWNCGEQCEKTPNNNPCYDNGKYCGFDMKYTDDVKGTDVLDEDLRQKCLYNQTYDSNTDLFWGYLEQINNLVECQRGATIDCSKKAASNVGVDWDKLEECASNTFDNPGNR